MTCCDEETKNIDEKVNDIIDAVMDYLFALVEDNAFSNEEYNQTVDLLIAKLEDAPLFSELE